MLMVTEVGCVNFVKLCYVCIISNRYLFHKCVIMLR